MLATGALELSLILAAAASYGASAPRRLLSLSLALATTGVPFLLPADQGFWRCFAAVFALLPLFKWIQSTADGDQARLPERLWQWTAIFDVRRARLTRPRFDPRLGFESLLGLAAGLSGIGLIRVHADAQGPVGVLGWYGGGLLAVLGWVQGITSAVRWIHLWFGLEVPPIQRRPWRSRSVREFWARRWNRTVHEWLNRYIFRPLARRGWPVSGVCWAFAVSALVHFYIAWVPAGPKMGALMASFFIAQIPLVLFERIFGRDDAPGWRLFTVVALLGTSPLFIIPLAVILGPERWRFGA